ncbi:hypothetical protein BW723_06540 [Polaribacter reichenbachii]|uniref:Secretion system C-terminal sorting domain-containing protein n=1 Tax=Polaribacter reichenbachii TaxID=996801 RepID=A0A1B8U643_9FLAO|nr:hypothetical protein [Polaribacter reichenbachii]APZ45971.1 hypothetical protein BW723_06540 [Polaribacter reichenbachii]AUC19833.1 hypothetical protein BTO17_14560 [Polaribacter reichenbachii]OBY67312.1 hypothetical protein LPB301_02950 [Polaribacter reichenbachii]
MKTIKRTVLVVVLMLGTLVNYANNSELKNVLDATKTKVVFKGTKKGQQLTIKDGNGVVLHFENVSKAGNLVKFFDFSKLKDGNYTLELEKDFEIVIKSIMVKGDNVVFNEDSKKIIFKPVIRNKENKLMISKIAFDKKPSEIYIYYNDEVIFSETVKSDAILNRIYSLDEDVKGSYTVVIRSNGRSFSNDFEI